jgi:hypothetical protein
MNSQYEGTREQILPLPWLQNVLVILGFCAIIVNTLFLLIWFIFVSLKVDVKIPKWIIIFNVVIFCCQVYFYFFLK